MSDPNEPAVKQEDFLTLLKGYTPSEKRIRERDVLAEQYRIVTNQPLPEFNSRFAKAFAARDVKNPDAALYALVFDSNAPKRQKNISTLKGFTNPNMVALLEEGVADISIFNEVRYVVVLEKPAGQSLEKSFAQGRNPVSEITLVNSVLRPLTKLLIELGDLGISHNRINLKNVYINHDRVTLGECISEPSGFSQDLPFETIDRALTSPWAKNDTSADADCYALAMLVMHLALGFAPFADKDREALMQEALSKGSYHTFVVQWDFSEFLQDFFRGLLNDGRRERWDAKSIETWLGGRRFNLILPSITKEATRSFDFVGTPHYNRKTLANSLFLNWAEARALLLETRLSRWLEASAHRADIAETVARITGSAMSEGSRAERYNNDLLARVIMTLDPTGPIRFRMLSVKPDGIATFLVYALLSGTPEEIQSLTQMLDADLPSFWAEQQKSTENNTLIWKLQKMRGNLRMTGLGFGIERALYDLQPGLACQSPLVKQYYAMDLPSLLYALDSVAPQKAANGDPMDRHIAAFITCKLELGRDVRVAELDMLPELASHPQMVMLKLLAQAQRKAGNPTLKGLSNWMALRILPLLDLIHKRSLRRNLQTELRAKAASGSLQVISDMLLNANTFVTDYNGFRASVVAYAQRSRHITELKNQKFLKRHARMAARGVAQTVAFSICFATVYYTLKSYFHF